MQWQEIREQYTRTGKWNQTIYAEIAILCFHVPQFLRVAPQTSSYSQVRHHRNAN